MDYSYLATNPHSAHEAQQSYLLHPPQQQQPPQQHLQGSDVPVDMIYLLEQQQQRRQQQQQQALHVSDTTIPYRENTPPSDGLYPPASVPVPDDLCGYPYSTSCFLTPQASQNSGSPASNTGVGNSDSPTVGAFLSASSRQQQQPLWQAQPPPAQIHSQQRRSPRNNTTMPRKMSNNSLDNEASSEEKEDEATMIRRKAQNRAAQRAFRERKEKRLKELEVKLDDYENNYSSMKEEHEQLKREMAKVATENEVLKAKAAISPSRHSPEYQQSPNHITNPQKISIVTSTGTMIYHPQEEDDNTPAHRIILDPESGEKLLNASATWDLVMEHIADNNIDIDVQRIFDKLKMHTRCNGQGPAVEEGTVRRALAEVIAQQQST